MNTPMSVTPATTSDYERVARAIHYLRDRSTQQPGLEEVADHVGLSPHHFQRVFTRWAGVSPKRFLQYLTVEHAKELLEQDRSVLETTFETGLSSPSRLHDLFIVARRPSLRVSSRRPGRGLHDLVRRWRYAVRPGPRREHPDRGIVALDFVDGALEAHRLGSAQRGAGAARPSTATTGPPVELLDRVFGAPDGQNPCAWCCGERTSRSRSGRPCWMWRSGRRDHLRPHRRRSLHAARLAGRRQRGRRQLDRVPDSLPPGDPGRWRTWQLPVGR